MLTAVVVDSTLLWDDFDLSEGDLLPDWHSLRLCYYQPGYASVMCFVRECGTSNEKTSKDALGHDL